MAETIDPTRRYPLNFWDTAFGDDDELSLPYGDWVLEDGGTDLRKDSALHSAVLMLLFTDRRAPDGRELPSDSDDRRGWFGDYVDVRRDLGETELGSLIWLYERSTLNDETVEGITTEATVALQPLIDQGAVASVSVDTEVDKIAGALRLVIRLYSADGQIKYDQRFHRIWQQAYPFLR